MYSSGHVDWLAVTYPATVSPNGTLPLLLSQSPWLKQSRGAHGYRSRLVNEIGASVMLDGDERQGTHLVLSGTALSYARAMGMTDRELCQHVVDNGGKASRLDVAINLYEANLIPSQIADAYVKKAIRTPAHSGVMITDINRPGSTFTLGNRLSQRYFRAYDKAAEQHVDHMAWLRLELECKKLWAQSLTAILASEPDTRGVINNAVRGYCDMENDEYQAALKQQAGELPTEGRKVHKTFAWLMDVVAPAVARYQTEHPDEDVVGALLTAIEVHSVKHDEGATFDNRVIISAPAVTDKAIIAK